MDTAVSVALSLLVAAATWVAGYEVGKLNGIREVRHLFEEEREAFARNLKKIRKVVLENRVEDSALLLENAGLKTELGELKSHVGKLVGDNGLYICPECPYSGACGGKCEFGLEVF